MLILGALPSGDGDLSDGAAASLPADMFVTWQDVRDAGQMVAYLLFLRKEKPPFGKYSFEEKITYWFMFFGVGIMVISGIILWFPEIITQVSARQRDPGCKTGPQHGSCRCRNLHRDLAFLPCSSSTIKP